MVEMVWCRMEQHMRDFRRCGGIHEGIPCPERKRCAKKAGVEIPAEDLLETDEQKAE